MRATEGNVRISYLPSSVIIITLHELPELSERRVCRDTQLLYVPSALLWTVLACYAKIHVGCVQSREVHQSNLRIHA